MWKILLPLRYVKYLKRQSHDQRPIWLLNIEYKYDAWYIVFASWYHNRYMLEDLWSNHCIALCFIDVCPGHMVGGKKGGRNHMVPLNQICCVKGEASDGHATTV